jgi:hypothetical protein
MIIPIKLILAHFIGDFLLQPKSWVKEKEIRKAQSIKFYIHILIHGILGLIVLWNFNYWFLAITLMVSHGVIDIIKLYAQKETYKPYWFLIDQSLHIISIIALWLLFFNPEFNIKPIMENPEIWIYAVALFFITIVSSIVMKVLMSSWSNALNENNEESLNNAGKYIGILERIFIFTFVIMGKWEGIGFLLAAKSIFRFGDLKESKDRKLTEYILIGTLLSFGIAIAVGMLVLKLNELI